MTGASRLQKIVEQLQRGKLPPNLAFSWEAPDMFRIVKRIDGSESRAEFAFVIRIEHLGGQDNWWPIVYVASDGETTHAEKLINGRTQVNLHKQNYLVDLAETWARTLEAQYVTKTVDNVLLT